MRKIKPLTNANGDVRELTKADFARMRPAAELLLKEFLYNWRKGKHTIVHETVAQWRARQRKLNANGNPIGRRPIEEPKVPVTMRLDADVMKFFRSGGEGWQTSLDAFLTEADHERLCSRIETRLTRCWGAGNADFSNGGRYRD